MFKIKLIKPYFWDKSGFNFFSLIFFPLTLITILINLSKKFNKKKKFDVKTICVGNIYLGGTGKTQLVIKLNEMLKKKYNISVIKKDYKNQVDEQDLLKKKTNLILAKQRIQGIKKIKKSKEIAIFDDGLQDKSINYDLSIVCFNSINGIGNGKLLPSGPLREKLSELKNYDSVFINGKSNISLFKKIKFFNKNIKIFYGKYFLKNKKDFSSKSKYLAFCGIGTPENFFNLLKENNIKVVKNLIFPDHFEYKSKDIENLKNIAIKNNLKLVTTEKDFMKIKKFKNFEVKFTDVDLHINNHKRFRRFLISYL